MANRQRFQYNFTRATEPGHITEEKAVGCAWALPLPSYLSLESESGGFQTILRPRNLNRA